MTAKKDRNLEDEFSSRNEVLREFYNADEKDLSKEESLSLTPILNSLTDNEVRYQRIRTIAEGGEKRISLSHDQRLNRYVAMAHAVRNGTPEDLEQFLREAQLTANLGHPNIVPVYNMGMDENGEPFFSMELIPGDSLKFIIKQLQAGNQEYQKIYSLEVLLNIFMKVCDAIAYAHSRSVLHLDIKPDNIRVGKFGEVFVCDWGLALVKNSPEEPMLEDESRMILDGDVLNDMTLSGVMKGTPGFMAPEQTYAGREKTEQTDVYALGALLYALLTYRAPVEGLSANEMIENTRNGKIIPVRRHRLVRPLAKSLIAIAMKALSLNAEERYDSVLSLRQDVVRYLSGYPADAEHAGLVTRASLLLKRHSRMAFLLISFLFVLAAVVGGNLIAISREKAIAVAERKKAEENFRLYKKEQKLTQTLGKDLGEAVLYTMHSRDLINASSMIHVLKSGLAEDMPAAERKQLLEQKGVLHFVLQQFNEASTCFYASGQSWDRIGVMWSLSKKYAKIKPEDDDQLTDLQMAQLLEEKGLPVEPILFYLYYHHMSNRPADTPPEEYAPLARVMLDLLNPTAAAAGQPLKLTKTVAGYHLDLSGCGYSKFSVSLMGRYLRNVLKGLSLSSLDISDNHSINDVYMLYGLTLDELRMSNVNIHGKSWFNQQFKDLKIKRVVLDVDAYPSRVISELSRKMEVINAGQTTPIQSVHEE
ncbi:MAG TPA: serine/threonine-protein kinase [Pontiella sp.]